MLAPLAGQQDKGCCAIKGGHTEEKKQIIPEEREEAINYRVAQVRKMHDLSAISFMDIGFEPDLVTVPGSRAAQGASGRERRSRCAFQCRTRGCLRHVRGSRQLCRVTRAKAKSTARRSNSTGALLREERNLHELQRQYLCRSGSRCCLDGPGTAAIAA